MKKIIVPVSGGKDSQSCLKMAVNHVGAENVIAFCCDTGWEEERTYRHISYMENLYGVPIQYIKSEKFETVLDVVLKQERFPSSRIRNCTKHMKILPTKLFYCSLRDKGVKGEVWMGMREAESTKRKAKYSKTDQDDLYLDYITGEYPKYLRDSFSLKLPILKWSDQEVFDYLQGEESPLYSEGDKRVGCYPCMASSYSSQIRCFDKKPERLERILEVSKKINVPYTFGKEYDDSQLCMFCQI